MDQFFSSMNTITDNVLIILIRLKSSIANLEELRVTWETLQAQHELMTQKLNAALQQKDKMKNVLSSSMLEVNDLEKQLIEFKADFGVSQERMDEAKLQIDSVQGALTDVNESIDREKTVMLSLEESLKTLEEQIKLQKTSFSEKGLVLDSQHVETPSADDIGFDNRNTQLDMEILQLEEMNAVEVEKHSMHLKKLALLRSEDKESTALG